MSGFRKVLVLRYLIFASNISSLLTAYTVVLIYYCRIICKELEIPVQRCSLSWVDIQAKSQDCKRRSCQDMYISYVRLEHLIPSPIPYFSTWYSDFISRVGILVYIYSQICTYMRWVCCKWCGFMLFSQDYSTTTVRISSGKRRMSIQEPCWPGSMNISALYRVLLPMI